MALAPIPPAGKILDTGRMALACLFAAGCYSTAATSPTPPQPVAAHPQPSLRPASFQCAHEAVEAVDPLVDHFAALGHEMWDQLHDPTFHTKQPSVAVPPNMDREGFAAFLLTSEGKVWLRDTGYFDSWYRGMIHMCETRHVASATR